MVFERLNEEIREWLYKYKEYLKPTLAQEAAIPPILEGKNVLLSAPTGYGKTLAAILPLFHKMYEAKLNELPGIKLLYLTPMRSLNRDVFKRVVELGSRIWIDTDVRHGDTSQRMRVLQSRMPPSCLITTPETLQAILCGERMRKHLASVKYVIVDEIHEIINSKRGAQLSIALERLAEVAGDFQRIGLSATIGDKELVSKFLVGTGRTCEVIDIEGKKQYSVSVEYPEPKAADASLARQLIIPENVAYCMRRMKEIMDSSQNSIIFTNTRQTAEVLGSRFKKWLPGLAIDVHHSSLSKDVRIDAENRFKDGQLKSIIATSSLELGIDIGNVDVVMQYMSPRQVTKLMQRVGRSAHTVKGVSQGVIFCIDMDDYLESMAIANEIHKWLEKPIMPEKPYDVLCNQIIGYCLQSRDVTTEHVLKLFRQAYPFRELEMDEINDVLKIMDEVKLCYLRDNEIVKTRKAFSYFFSNLSMIPDEKTYYIIDKELNKRIGVLHQEFVVQHIKLGARFLMKGEAWRVVETDEDKIYVHSEPEISGAVPSWEGELIPVPRRIAESVATLRKNVPAIKSHITPGSSRIVIEHAGSYVIIHSCFGTKVNETLCKVLAAIISTEIGASIGTKVDPYRIVLKLPAFTEHSIVSRKLNELKPEWVREILMQSLKNTPLFSFRFFHIAKRFGLLGKDADFRQNRVQYLISVLGDSKIIQETFNEIFREKMDIAETAEIVSKFNKGIEIIDSDEPISPLGMLGLEFSEISSFVQPKEAFREIMEIIRERLLKKRFFFMCTRCGETLGSFSVRNVPELVCRCGAKTIGFVPERDKAIAMRVLKRNNLSDDDKRVLNYIKRTAELFLYYDKDAVFACAAYGVGPETARRILSRGSKGDDLLRDIIDAERNFLRTRQFWENSK